MLQTRPLTKPKSTVNKGLISIHFSNGEQGHLVQRPVTFRLTPFHKFLTVASQLSYMLLSVGKELHHDYKTIDTPVAKK